MTVRGTSGTHPGKQPQPDIAPLAKAKKRGLVAVDPSTDALSITGSNGYGSQGMNKPTTGASITKHSALFAGRLASANEAPLSYAQWTGRSR